MKENFGIEGGIALLSVKVVAKKFLVVLTSDFSVVVFDVNRSSLY